MYSLISGDGYENVHITHSLPTIIIYKISELERIMVPRSVLAYFILVSFTCHHDIMETDQQQPTLRFHTSSRQS